MEVGSTPHMTGNNRDETLTSARDRHVQQVVKCAHEELRALSSQRVEIMERIGTVKQVLGSLADMFGNEILNNELLELLDRRPRHRTESFTKACRTVLMECGKPLGTSEVCQRIRQRMPTVLARHRNPQASVTTVLNRLVGYGEVRTTRKEDGRRVWEWIVQNSTSPCSETETLVP